MTAAECIRARLLEMQDAEYRAFQAKLMPTVDVERIIGVRVPAQRVYAKELKNTAGAAEFMRELPHRYYEEDNLHAFLIEGMRDYDACLDALNAFLPYVDNWATCDMMSPKVLKKNLPQTLAQAQAWMQSNHTYTIRYGIGTLMRFFLDEAFDPVHLEWVAALRSEDYYVRMMVAWYFATALAKQYDAALSFIEQRKLDAWTHNKAIQKAVESYRISPEQKQHLKKYRISCQKQS